MMKNEPCHGPLPIAKPINLNIFKTIVAEVIASQGRQTPAWGCR